MFANCPILIYWQYKSKVEIIFPYICLQGKKKAKWMSQPELPGPLESFLNPISNFEACFFTTFLCVYCGVNHKSPPLSKQACVFSVFAQRHSWPICHSCWVYPSSVMPLDCLIWRCSPLITVYCLSWDPCWHWCPSSAWTQTEETAAALKQYPEKQPLVRAIFTLWPR